MFPVVNIGSLAIRTPGLILLLGLWIGLNLSERQATRENARVSPDNSSYHPPTPDQIYTLVFITLIVAVIGARLAYLLENPGIFSDSPSSLLSLDTGLLDPLGGIGAGFLAALIYGNRKKLDFWTSLDVLTPLFALLGVAQGFADLASGDAFGIPAQVPWCINIWGACRQPTQIYEMLSATAILLAIWLTKEQYWKPGMRFLIFLALSAAARLMIETFRGDSILLPIGIRLAQVLAWGVLGVTLWLIGKKLKELR